MKLTARLTTRNIYKAYCSNNMNKQSVHMKGGKMKFQYFIAAFMLLFLVSFISASNVNFGDWQNGTTLYSDAIHLNNNTFYGRNAYPIRDYTPVLTCKNITQTVKERVCTTKPNGRTTCTYVYHKEITQQCKMQVPSIAAGCNNSNGVYTNALYVTAFQYSINGGSWLTIPYHLNDLRVINQTVQFRVTVPAKCYPSYDINNAVTIV